MEDPLPAFPRLPISSFHFWIRDSLESVGRAHILAYGIRSIAWQGTKYSNLLTFDLDDLFRLSKHETFLALQCPMCIAPFWLGWQHWSFFEWWFISCKGSFTQQLLYAELYGWCSAHHFKSGWSKASKECGFPATALYSVAFKTLLKLLWHCTSAGASLEIKIYALPYSWYPAKKMRHARKSLKKRYILTWYFAWVNTLHGNLHSGISCRSKRWDDIRM